MINKQRLLEIITQICDSHCLQSFDFSPFLLDMAKLFIELSEADNKLGMATVYGKMFREAIIALRNQGYQNITICELINAAPEEDKDYLFTLDVLLPNAHVFLLSIFAKQVLSKRKLIVEEDTLLDDLASLVGEP